MRESRCWGAKRGNPAALLRHPMRGDVNMRSPLRKAAVNSAGDRSYNSKPRSPDCET